MLDADSFRRADICPGCRRDTRVCKNCEFFDTAYNNQCRETQADRVVEKEKSNFCDFFKAGTPVIGGGDAVSKARAAAEALFKKK